jgi:hypothetical protein
MVMIIIVLYYFLLNSHIVFPGPLVCYLSVFENKLGWVDSFNCTQDFQEIWFHPVGSFRVERFGLGRPSEDCLEGGGGPGGQDRGCSTGPALRCPASGGCGGRCQGRTALAVQRSGRLKYRTFRNGQACIRRVSFVWRYPTFFRRAAQPCL